MHSTPKSSVTCEKVEPNQTSWTTYCPSCRAKVTLPRTTPPFGTTLVCPTCKTPVQTIHEDPPGCPVSWDPKLVQMVFGYERCCLEHPRCPWCGKIAYAVVFPERGREVAWYAVRQQQNPMANYAIQVECTNCSRTFTVEWDGWPFSLDSHSKQCCFCGIEFFGDTMCIPEDRRSTFEGHLGRKASRMAYLRDENGKSLWMACPICLKAALSNYDQEQGTDLAQAYSIGPELDPFVDELLMIDKTDGLMDERGIMDKREGCSSAYDSDHRHKRGREIGEILCNRGGNKLMVRVGGAFVDRGGTEWRLSHCWNKIKDDAGHIAWFA